VRVKLKKIISIPKGLGGTMMKTHDFYPELMKREEKSFRWEIGGEPDFL
jgi:hypothetical protein